MGKAGHRADHREVQYLLEHFSKRTRLVLVVRWQRARIFTRNQDHPAVNSGFRKVQHEIQRHVQPALLRDRESCEGKQMEQSSIISLLMLYLPSKLGFRFSTNASAPSRASRVYVQVITASVS